MPIKTTRVNNLPIVISAYIGHITRDEMEQMFEDTAQLLADAGDRYYRISDLTHAETDFGEYMKLISTMNQTGKFRTTDPNMRVVFVGSNKWIYNTRNLAAQRGITLTAFLTIDEAMQYIHLDMANHVVDETA